MGMWEVLRERKFKIPKIGEIPSKENIEIFVDAVKSELEKKPVVRRKHLFKECYDYVGICNSEVEAIDIQSKIHLYYLDPKTISKYGIQSISLSDAAHKYFNHKGQYVSSSTMHQDEYLIYSLESKLIEYLTKAYKGIETTELMRFEFKD
jgi:hypothetical protein